MKDRIPSKPNRRLITPENGGGAFYATIERADQPVEAGTPLNKATLLADETAAMYGLDGDAATVNEALKKGLHRTDDLMARNFWRQDGPYPNGNYYTTDAVYAEGKLYALSNGNLHIYDFETGLWTQTSGGVAGGATIRMTYYDGFVYCAGVYISNKYFQRYNIATGAWQTRKELNSADPVYAMGGYDGKIYVFRSSGVSIYNISSNNWSNGATSGWSTSNHWFSGGMGEDGIMYIRCGAGTGSGYSPYSTTLYKYNTITNTWASETISNVVGRAFHASVYKNRKLYTLGGMMRPYITTYPSNYIVSDVLSIVEIYDIDTKKVEYLPSINIGRALPGVYITDENELHCLGGVMPIRPIPEYTSSSDISYYVIQINNNNTVAIPNGEVIKL